MNQTIVYGVIRTLAIVEGSNLYFFLLFIVSKKIFDFSNKNKSYYLLVSRSSWIWIFFSFLSLLWGKFHLITADCYWLKISEWCWPACFWKWCVDASDVPADVPGLSLCLFVSSCLHLARTVFTWIDGMQLHGGMSRYHRNWMELCKIHQQMEKRSGLVARSWQKHLNSQMVPQVLHLARGDFWYLRQVLLIYSSYLGVLLLNYICPV